MPHSSPTPRRDYRSLPLFPRLHSSPQFLASNLRETSRKDLHECHSYGQWALQQIKKQHRLHSQQSNGSTGNSGGGIPGSQAYYNSIHSQYTLSNEVIYGDSQHPPMDFYSHAIERLEGRLEKSIHEIQEVFPLPFSSTDLFPLVVD